MNITPIVILTDLDSILDTRLSTYHKILGDDVGKVIQAGYYDRIYDRFDCVNYDEYIDAYKKRDKTYLDTPMTNVIDFIIETLVSLKSSNVSGREQFEPSILLNIHPYDLLDEEKEVILAGFRAAVGYSDIKMSIIDKTLEELTPDELNDMDIGMYITYGAEEWMQIQREVIKTFDTQSTPDIGLIAPKLITRKTNDPKGLLKNTKMDPFRSYEMITEPVISLRFLPSELFSAKPLIAAVKK